MRPLQHKSTTVGSALANTIFPLVGMDTTGTMVWRQRLPRPALVPLLAPLPPVTSGMEACGGAPAWTRPGCPQGPTVPRMAPLLGQPDVQSTKNARRAAAALAAAVPRPPRRVVPLHAIAPHEGQARHRGRERRSGARTALLHAVPGCMPVEGIVRPQGVTTCRPAVVEQRAAAKATRPALRQALGRQWLEELVALDEQRASDPEPRATRAAPPPERPRRLTMPGIGPRTAPALRAAVGAVGGVQNGRPCAAWCGRVLHQHATGGHSPWFGGSQRGASSRRQLWLPGARATRRGVKRPTARRSPWLRGGRARRGWHRTAVAVAHKTARIGWALRRRGGVYEVAGGASDPQPREGTRGKRRRQQAWVSMLLPGTRLDSPREELHTQPERHPPARGAGAARC